MIQIPHHRRPASATELLIAVPSDIRNENTPSIRFFATPGEEPVLELGLD
jgi:hypothetical protein